MASTNPFLELNQSPGMGTSKFGGAFSEPGRYPGGQPKLPPMNSKLPATSATRLAMAILANRAPNKNFLA